MGRADKKSARLALNRDPKTKDEAMSLMRQFRGHEKALTVERRVRTLALNEVDPVDPQVNRVQEERSFSLDVGELNENIEMLTKLLANMNMDVVKRGTLSAIVDQMCRGPTPDRGIGYMSKPPR